VFFGFCLILQLVLHIHLSEASLAQPSNWKGIPPLELAADSNRKEKGVEELCLLCSGPGISNCCNWAFSKLTFGGGNYLALKLSDTSKAVSWSSVEVSLVYSKHQREGKHGIDPT
jgi:hypothetical protein